MYKIEQFHTGRHDSTGQFIILTLYYFDPLTLSLLVVVQCIRFKESKNGERDYLTIKA